tara:strand:- start:32 stop:538 length:507 start_codon:yes stop_codon:yes gene_type:complete
MKYTIYKLTCETGKIYIGITFRKLQQRLNDHNSKSNRCSSKSFINPTIEILEEIYEDDKQERNKRERYWMEQFDSVNVKKEFRTEEEIKKDHIKSVEKYNQNMSEEQKKDLTRKKVDYSRGYREEHREQFRQFDREYREKNRAKINERARINYEKRKQNKILNNSNEV